MRGGYRLVEGPGGRAAFQASCISMNGPDADRQRIWMDRIGALRQAFTHPGWRIFQTLMAGWVVCTGRRTIIGIYQQADPEHSRSHDVYHRFVRCAAWVPEQVWKLLAQAMVAKLVPSGVLELDLDDTLLHRTGRKVDGAGSWRDAVRSYGKRTVIAWGLNLLVVTLRIKPPWGGEPLGLPIWVSLHRKDGTKLTTLAEEAMNTIATWFPDRHIRCCGDGAYASTLMPLHGPQRTCISRMRRDAALYECKPSSTGKPGRPRNRGMRIGNPVEIAKRARCWTTVVTDQRGKPVTRLLHSRIVLWYKVSKQPVQLVICRDPDGKEPDDFWVCSDIQMPAAEVVGAYAGRWSIEDTFRATKQTIHVQQPQSWAGEGPLRAAVLGFLLYSLVWWWFLSLPKAAQRVEPTPWFTSKATPSFADAMAKLREVFWRNRIYDISGHGPIRDEIIDAMLDALSRAA